MAAPKKKAVANAKKSLPPLKNAFKKNPKAKGGK